MPEKFSQVPEELWALVAPLLPPEPPKPYGGRPRVPDKAILAGVLYKRRTGCQWKALPRQFGSGSTCHRRFSERVESGLFPEIMGAVLKFYDQKCGIAWDWTAVASSPSHSAANRPRASRLMYSVIPVPSNCSTFAVVR